MPRIPPNPERSMVPLAMKDDVDHVVENVSSLARRRSGRLMSVYITAPDDWDLLHVRESIASELAATGHYDVLLVVTKEEGPMRVVAATFENPPKYGQTNGPPERKKP